jgi:hypothetical protein
MMGGTAVDSIEATSKNEQSNQIAERVRNALPVVAIVLALIVNAAWIGFLGYWFFLKLVT